MRSMLFVPAANPKALAKSPSLKPDAIIFDLEDSANGAEKDQARENLAKHLEDKNHEASILIRVNATESNFHTADLALVAKASSEGKLHGVVLPKVDNAEQILSLEQHLEDLGADDSIKLWAMIETPLGVLNAEKIAASTSSLEGFILGLEDLSTKMEISTSKDRSNVSFAMQKVVMSAKAFGMLAIDSVCKSYKSEAALNAEAELALAFGFNGKSLIHPSQIEPCNKVFGVSDEALEEAHKVIDAFEAALAEGKSVATLDGNMVEELHFEAAKKLVLKHRGYNA